MNYISPGNVITVIFVVNLQQFFAFAFLINAVFHNKYHSRALECDLISQGCDKKKI